MDDWQYKPISEPVRVARVVGATGPRLAFPLVTLVLILANLLMAFAQFGAAGFHAHGLETIGSDATDWALGAKVPSLVAHGEYWRLVTANFLHGTWWPHLFSNMLGLLIVGTLIEAYYGRTRTLIIYTVASVTGTIASYFLTPSVSLGASTGIMGLMGALLIHYLKQLDQLPERVRVVLPFLVIVLLVQFGMDSINKQVDLYGHAGGLAGGMLMAFLLASQGHWSPSAQRDRIPLRAALALTLALLAYAGFGLLTTLPNEGELIRAGEANSAVGQSSHLERVVERRPYFVEAQLALADLLKRQNRDEEAAVHYQQALIGNPRSKEVRQRLEVLAATYLREAERDFSAHQWEQAAQNYLRATQYPARSEILADAHNGYAWVLADKLNRNLTDAERHAHLALKSEPNNEAILDTLAWVYYKQKRYDDALGQQLKAVRIFESKRNLRSSSELYYHLGAIYEGQGQKSQARFFYTKALESGFPVPAAATALRRLDGALNVTPTPKPRLVLPDPAALRGII